ncbi:MAG: hypothetical protein ABI690_35055 [Chloroflexota bacterium]
MANDKINKARDLIDEGKYAQARNLLRGNKDPKAKRLMAEIDDLAPAQSGSGAKDALHVILMGLIFTALFGGIGYVVASSMGIPNSGSASVGDVTPVSTTPVQTNGDATQAPQSVVIEPTVPPPPTEIPCEAQAWWDANNATAAKLIGGAINLTIQSPGQQVKANKDAYDAWISGIQSQPLAACLSAAQGAIVTAAPQVSALYNQFLTTSTEQTQAQTLVQAMDALLPATDEIGKLSVTGGDSGWIESVQDFSRADCTAKRWYNEIILGKDYKRFFTLLDALDFSQAGAATNSLREMQGLVGSFQADSAGFPACVKTASDALQAAMNAFVMGSNARLQNDAANADAQIKAANTGLANFYSELGKLDQSLAGIRLKK